MTNRKLALVDVLTINTIDDVLINLQSLDDQFNQLNLDQFILFNKSYQVVTRLIQQSIDDDYFKNPKFIESFIVNFAGYYFEAVNNANSNDKLSAPWSKLNDYANIESAPVFISLMLGANAHINYDLPQVLNKMMQDENATNFLGDIVKINRILMKSGRQIIDLFEEKNKHLNFLKKRLIFTYYHPAMYTILYWRFRAWRHYEMLKKDSSMMPSITKRSVKIANRLLRAAKILS